MWWGRSLSQTKKMNEFEHKFCKGFLFFVFLQVSEWTSSVANQLSLPTSQVHLPRLDLVHSSNQLFDRVIQICWCVGIISA